LHDNRFFSIRRRTVVPAFALGIFIGFLPVPGHLVIAAGASVPLRVHIPLAMISTLISNPFTLPAIYYGCFRVGQVLLGLPPQPFSFELSFDWVTHQFMQIWQPMLLGCLLVGAISATIGYIALDLLWRASIADYLAKRRSKKR
jgi:uncharacterized protein (DUF2062 family)